MAPPSSSKRSTDAPERVDAVAEARTRARRRLVGAVVLLGVAIIVFPLVFETQPRPVAVDIPIEIPRKDGAPPLVMPAPRVPTPASVAAPSDDAIVEPRAEARPPAAAAPASAAAPSVRPAEASTAAAEKAGDRAEAKAAVRSASAPARPASAPARATASAPADGVRAQALLDGNAPGAAAGPRYIVQVGAFADPASAREVRAKVEKLGLKTYTQVAETNSGSRIRVRMGPFENRDEADRALARAKAAGLDGVVLAL